MLCISIPEVLLGDTGLDLLRKSLIHLCASHIGMTKITICFFKTDTKNVDTHGIEIVRSEYINISYTTFDKYSTA